MYVRQQEGTVHGSTTHNRSSASLWKVTSVTVLRRWGMGVRSQRVTGIQQLFERLVGVAWEGGEVCNHCSYMMRGP
jgi:hypothetical protein